jgi:hypothetical protein
MEQEAQEILSYINKLPSHIREIVLAMEWISRVEEIGQKYSLNKNQTTSITHEVLFVLSGMEDEEYLVENIKTEQVLASEGVWAVFYETKPINLKTSNMLVQYPGPKYKKVSFSNPGHAKNLAKKLNVMFKTDKFSVVLLRQGEKVYP